MEELYERCPELEFIYIRRHRTLLASSFLGVIDDQSIDIYTEYNFPLEMFIKELFMSVPKVLPVIAEVIEPKGGGPANGLDVAKRVLKANGDKWLKFAHVIRVEICFNEATEFYYIQVVRDTQKPDKNIPKVVDEIKIVQKFEEKAKMQHP